MPLSASVKTIGIQFQNIAGSSNVFICFPWVNISYISDKWKEQPKVDLFPLYEKVKEYSGLIPMLNGCLETAKEAEARVLELESAVCFAVEMPCS